MFRFDNVLQGFFLNQTGLKVTALCQMSAGIRGVLSAHLALCLFLSLYHNLTVCLCVDMWTCQYRGQNVSGPLELKLWAIVSCPCGCWELNLGPLQELYALLTSEPFLQGLQGIFSRHLEIASWKSWVCLVYSHTLPFIATQCKERWGVKGKVSPETVSIILWPIGI